MINYSAYPTGTDLSSRLTMMGLTPFDDQTMESFAEQAWQDWEHRTGWTPWLSQVQTRNYDLPGVQSQIHSMVMGGNRFLNLRAGLLSVSQVLLPYGVVSQQDVDFYLLPYNAPQEGRPYTDLELVFIRFAQAKTIQITGLWGYESTLEPHIWETILKMGIMNALPMISVAKYGPVSSWKDDTVSETYGGKNAFAFSGLIDQWKEETDNEIKGHRRMPGWT